MVICQKKVLNWNKFTKIVFPSDLKVDTPVVNPRYLFDQSQQLNKVNVVLVSSLLTLKKFHTFFGVFIVDVEKVNVGWDFQKMISMINIIEKRQCSKSQFVYFEYF